MLCLSHKGTTNLIRKLTADHDKDVLWWRDSLKERIQVFCVSTNCVLQFTVYQHLPLHFDTDSNIMLMNG